MPKIADKPRDVFDAGSRGLQHNGLRRANERAVLTVIGFNGGVSNAEISRLSGLAPQTVSAILVDIEEAGLITRGDVLRGKRGQPATPIFLRPDGAYAIGAEIGLRHAEVLLINLVANVSARREIRYAYPRADHVLPAVGALMNELRATLPMAAQKRVFDVGVTLPSDLSATLPGFGATPDEAELWQTTDPVAVLGQATGLDISVFNDGNAACWGELIAFSKPRPANFAYLLVSNVIAAGIAVDGALWDGPDGQGSNLGAMLVADARGDLQSVHRIASLEALAQRLRTAGFCIDDGDAGQWPWDSFGPVLDRWIVDSARALAMVIFNTAAAIGSGLVVIDGALPADLVGRLVGATKDALAALPPLGAGHPQVVAGHLGASAPAIGAAELALYRRFFMRTLLDLAG